MRATSLTERGPVDLYTPESFQTQTTTNPKNQDPHKTWTEPRGPVSRLHQAETIRQDTVAALPKPAELFHTFRESYSEEIKKVTSEAAAYQKALNLLRKAVTKKKTALFAEQDLQWTTAEAVLSLDRVSEILRGHNELAESLDVKRQEAGRRVETAMAAEIRQAFETGRDEAKSAETEKDKLLKEQTELQRQTRLAVTDNYDPAPLAAELNEHVSQLLGHDTLAFAIDGKGYRITRDGRPARHLSEGERNAISLLYFLQSLKAHGSDATNSVVVIDDPVSSLDGNALAGASAHLWSELVGPAKCRQLFVLTHNFELLRTWMSQLDWLANRNELTIQTFEMRTVVRALPSGDTVRSPALVAWPADPKLRNRLRSEYHYLFWRIASELVICKTAPSPEHDLEVATVLPNACRRLLEAFLGFKSPELVGNFHHQVMHTGGSAVSTPVRTRLLRFLHAYSHNEDADVSRPAGRPEAVAMLDVVFEFMRAIDASHVDSMCRAVDVNLEPVLVSSPSQEETKQ